MFAGSPKLLGRTRLRAASFAVMSAMVTHAACSAPPEPMHAPDPAAPVTVARPSVAPSSSAPSTETAAPAPRASAAPVAPAAPAPPTPDPATFACGSTTCRTQLETCCAAGDEGTCVPTVNDGPGGAIGYLHTQWEQCSVLQAAAQRNFDRLARCDESADCPGREICCENFLFSGSNGLADCMAPLRSGETPCDFAETCIQGSPCRTPGTECVRGACTKKPVNQRCDTKTCTAAAPYCCGDTCMADPTCGGGPRVMCTKDADCVKGERCLDNGGGTLCLRAYPDPDHAPWICKTAAECRNACNGYGNEPPHGKPVCESASVPWLKRCGCDG